MKNQLTFSKSTRIDLGALILASLIRLSGLHHPSPRDCYPSVLLPKRIFMSKNNLKNTEVKSLVFNINHKIIYIASNALLCYKELYMLLTKVHSPETFESQAFIWRGFSVRLRSIFDCLGFVRSLMVAARLWAGQKPKSGANKNFHHLWRSRSGATSNAGIPY